MQSNTNVFVAEESPGKKYMMKTLQLTGLLEVVSMQRNSIPGTSFCQGYVCTHPA